MAEFAVRLKDKHPDFSQSKRGDVIVVCPDGWSWGKEELAGTDWRIVKAPNVSVDDLTAAFMEPGRRSSPTQEPNTVPFRAARFNVDLLDDGQEPTTINMTFEEMLAARTLVV